MTQPHEQSPSFAVRRITAARRRWLRAVAPGVLAALLLSACAGDEDGDQTSPVAATESPTTDAPATDRPDAGPGATQVPEDTGALDLSGLPDTPEGQAAAWVLSFLEDGATGPDQAQADERFHPDFLAQITVAELEAIMMQLRDLGPVQVGSTQDLPVGEDTHLLVELSLSGDPWLLQIGLVDGLISTLWFGPDDPVDPVEVPDLGSWQDLETELGESAELVSVYAADVEDGACQTWHASDPAAAAPSGSTVKLGVLAAVAEAVETGDLGWDTELTLEAGHLSLPSGILQDEPVGTVVTVREAAELMIGISDNTATDLLMDVVGLDRIEEYFIDLGVDASQITPLLTTRQLFLLGWGDPEALDQWAAADPAQRRALVAELSGDLSQIDLEALLSTVVWPQEVEYFFTGADLCAVLADLQVQALTDAGEPIRDILADNPGLEQHSETTYQGFKGGSSPGAEAMAFYIEAGRDEVGSGRVLVIQVANTDEPLTDESRVGAYQAGLDLLAQAAADGSLN